MAEYKMQMIDFKEQLRQYEATVNSALEAVLADYHPSDRQSIIYDAMRYSLMAGGKRLRPILTLEFCKMFGGSMEAAMPFACAVECIHTYSLIHDDLPCMDNDDCRRGRPSCHKQFGEANALLAGDGLLTLAFGLLASAPASAQIRTEAVTVLSEYAGVAGMVGGQVIDLSYEDKPLTEEILRQMYSLKTSALFAAACKLGALAGGAGREAVEQAAGYAHAMGLAFQITDDILDVTGTQEILGKPVGSDQDNNKTTYVTLYGVDKAASMAEQYTKKAKEYLAPFPGNEFLLLLTDYLCVRDH